MITTTTRSTMSCSLDDGGGKRVHGKSPEPTSVLYNRSPSPPTSSSHSHSEPPPISAEDWEAVLLSGTDMAAPAPAAHTQDSSFLRWIMDAGYADGDGDAFGFKGPAFFDPNFMSPLPPAPMPMQQQHREEVFSLPQLPQQLPVPAQAQPGPVLSAAAAREDVDVEPLAGVEVLLEGARRADAGDSTGAREILARLNQRLPSPPAPPGHPPLLRAAALLRDALLQRLPPTAAAVPSGSVRSPLDVALKLAAHKALADASPTVQFAGFTSTQAFLDELGAGARRVHVVDFDIGFGGHLPPLMQELAHQWRRSAGPPPTLKVTALVSPGSRHPLELHLTHESLTRFAAELGIPFEFTAVAFDPFGPSPPVGLSAGPDETVAVHLTIGTDTSAPTPASLRVIKQLRPAIVVCVDHGCDRADLPLPNHSLNVLRSCAAIVESLDTAGASPDVVAKVEQFILRPRAERLITSNNKLPPWRSMFASTGFTPLQLSNATEAQAECLLRRTANHGFHVEKRQAALALWWQQAELVSVSAWQC
jgi:hypothetical protein